MRSFPRRHDKKVEKGRPLAFTSQNEPVPGDGCGQRGLALESSRAAEATVSFRQRGQWLTQEQARSSVWEVLASRAV